MSGVLTDGGRLEFQAWPKTPRYYREIVVTEKIDGTNGAVCIERFPYGEFAGTSTPPDATLVVGTELDQFGNPVDEYLVVAQSRKRIATPDNDNAGFAKWVWENATHLVDDLGPGRHFGEWWGSGIQRNYGRTEKTFSLFNTHKWSMEKFSGTMLPQCFTTPRLDVVPVLYQGPHDQESIEDCLTDLANEGSYVAADGWTGKAEGVCIFHTASNQVYKVTLENDETPKSLVNA